MLLKQLKILIINSIMLTNYSMCVEVGLEHIHVQHVCTTFKGWDNYCVNIILFISYVRSLLLCIYFFCGNEMESICVSSVCVCVHVCVCVCSAERVKGNYHAFLTT